VMTLRDIRFNQLEYTPSPWPNFRPLVESRGLDLEQAEMVPIGHGASVFVFPERKEHLGVSVPRRLAEAQHDGLEMELVIEKMERVEYKRNAALFIFVTPGKARLMKEGQALWRGRVEVLASEE